MADGRIIDFTRTIVTSKSTMTHQDENINRKNLESAINGANDVLIDLEQNYASTSSPTSAPDGKIWYDSTPTAAVKARIDGAWKQLAHDGMGQGFTFGGDLNIDGRMIPDYIPASKENGIILFENGVIYLFDRWEGTNILTGSNAKPVPYKKSLSNVYTGFEVIGYNGNGNSLHFLNLHKGFNWFKSRTDAVSNVLTDLLRCESYWFSQETLAHTFDISAGFRENSYSISRIGASANLNVLGSKYITWNWSYSLAKAWHAPGGTSKEVLNPISEGLLDSVESNASSGITGDQVIFELYNPLIGNGCLLYVGNGASRLLDISGGLTPDFIISKVLTTTGAGTTYHKGYNGETDPGDYRIDINATHVQQNDNTAWNDIESTNSLISLGTSALVNSNNNLCILYYFSSVPGLQDFGGYAGNATTNNQATGCKDGMFFTKSRLGAVGNWSVYDHVRGADNALNWNLTAVESTAGNVAFNATSGIDLSGSDADVNASGVDYIYGHFGKELVPQGDIDVYPTTSVTSTGTNDKVKITFEYSGAATLNTELLIYASRESTPDWIQGTLVKLADISDGYDLLSAVIDISANDAGTDMRWRIATSESGSETQHDIKNLKMFWY